jgi:Zn-finger nucleic acid-binding protein
MQLEEIAYEGIRLDKCPACEGVWLDNGELERLRTKEDGFLGRLLGIFQS